MTSEPTAAQPEPQAGASAGAVQPWPSTLPRILATRQALGRSRREGDGWLAP